MEKSGGILMHKFELGKLLGKGTFAKVYRARNINTGQSVAIKVINKAKALRVGLTDQIKREISVMSLVKHRNVVQLYEVMASKTKIYFVMEYVKGGELFNKVAKGRLNEDLARRYFRQLIDAVDFCHSRGVYHRDLKPENLLLDEEGNLKISDFGLSALWDSRRNDGLLHTSCGTPAYVAPEVLTNKGYDGAKADIWSCGVILYVLLAGKLPFNDPSLIEMYRKISKGEFKCPKWIPTDVRRLLLRIIDPNPNRRIAISKVKENGWFRKGCDNKFHLDGDEYNETNDYKKMETEPACTPASFNAFDIITLSRGFDLSGLFEEDLNNRPRSWFITKEPTSSIVSKFEELARMDKFKMKRKNGTLKLERNDEGRKDQLGIEAEIFEVAPSFYVVEVEKTAGDTIDFKIFNEQDLRPSLKDIVWTWQ